MGRAGLVAAMPRGSLWTFCPEASLNLSSIQTNSVSSLMGVWPLLPGTASGLQRGGPLLGSDVSQGGTPDLCSSPGVTNPGEEEGKGVKGGSVGLGRTSVPAMSSISFILAMTCNLLIAFKKPTKQNKKKSFF